MVRRQKADRKTILFPMGGCRLMSELSTERRFTEKFHCWNLLNGYYLLVKIYVDTRDEACVITCHNVPDVLA